MSVKFIKFISGDEIVGDVTVEEKSSITIKNPVRIIYAQEGVGMMPLCPFSKETTYTFANSHVLFKTEVEPNVANGYNQQYGSGIVTASAMPPANMKLITGDE